MFSPVFRCCCSARRCARADDHHWTAVQSGHDNPLNCGPSYIVGVGSESRNSKVIFPAGYGYYVSPGDNKFGANLHLLHTVGLGGEDEYQAVKVRAYVQACLRSVQGRRGRGST